MLIQQMRQEVTKRVQERLVEECFGPLLEQHKRHGLKTGCQCDFCTKRVILGNKWKSRRKAERAFREASWLMPVPDRFPSFQSVKQKWKTK